MKIIFWMHNINVFLLAGPEITLLKELDASKLIDNNTQPDFATGPFKINTQQLLNSYARQLWLFAKYQIENTESKYNYH